jgi:nitrate/nitrite-specific signal transduction histidine kinase
MGKRKKTLINREYQLKTSVKIMGLILLFSLLFIAATGTHAVLKNREIEETSHELKEAIAIEDNIIRAFVDYSRTHMDFESSEILALKKINDDHARSIATMNKYLELLRSYGRQLIVLIAAAAALAALMAVAAFIYLIRLTHRVSGPLHIMEQNIDKILNGEQPQLRDLRKKDEFKGLHKKFNRLTDLLGR